MKDNPQNIFFQNISKLNFTKKKRSPIIIFICLSTFIAASLLSIFLNVHHKFNYLFKIWNRVYSVWKNWTEHPRIFGQNDTVIWVFTDILCFTQFLEPVLNIFMQFQTLVFPSNPCVLQMKFNLPLLFLRKWISKITH